MTHAYTTNEQSHFTDMPVGEILRRTRMHYGQSLEDIETNIRIRAHIVQALEENDIEKLPARVYAIGFVRSYSQYLGLDPDKMVQLFKTQAGDRKSGPDLYIPTAENDNKSPPVWLVLSSILLLCVVAVIWASTWMENREGIEDVPPVPREFMDTTSQEEEAKEGIIAFGPPAPDELQVPQATEGQPQEGLDSPQEAAEETAEPVPASPAQTQEMIVDSSKTGILLMIRENSWVEIRDNTGKRILSRVLKSGDRYFVPDRPDLMMSLGNAGGVEITVDGQALKPLGADAQVKRNIPLDAAYLKKNFMANP